MRQRTGHHTMGRTDPLKHQKFFFTPSKTTRCVPHETKSPKEMRHEYILDMIFFFRFGSCNLHFDAWDMNISYQPKKEGPPSFISSTLQSQICALSSLTWLVGLDLLKTVTAALARMAHGGTVVGSFMGFERFRTATAKAITPNMLITIQTYSLNFLSCFFLKWSRFDIFHG